ncbi:hypothetical protein HOF65_04370 [bacterium]|nr:hypothetical protein [bacterium]MBT3853199.1 hypothetical protein [bacterium]MBT4633699.1 hypothetical protein [bacterium]MBT5492460.1 hypothetical protein [bacterium]MBT6779395.1 hypothetical protein [bacterium]
MYFLKNYFAFNILNTKSDIGPARYIITNQAKAYIIIILDFFAFSSSHIQVSKLNQA